VTDVSGRGRTVILLHGQPGTAGDWQAVAEDLSYDHQVVVPDRLGYGRTGGRAGGFAANARAVARLMNRLACSPSLVVGHSWAGGVALETAADFPAQVAGIGLVASVAPGEPLSRMDRVLAKPLLGTVSAALTLSVAGRLLASAPGRALTRRQARSQRDALARLATSWDRPSTWRSFVTEQRALVNELPSLQPRLNKLTIPALVLVGSADRVVGTGSGPRLASALPAASLEVVTGAGHLLPQLEPAAVAAALRRLAQRAFGQE